MELVTPPIDAVGRREAAGFAAVTLAMLAAPALARARTSARGDAIKMICVIRYEIHAFQREGLKKHAESLIAFVPRCGGHLVSYCLPYEGANDVARGLIMFDSVTGYEAYRGRLKTDPEAIADAKWMHRPRIILREERNFVEVVDGTFKLPPTGA